jgi:uncharacterized protein
MKAMKLSLVATAAAVVGLGQLAIPSTVQAQEAVRIGTSSVGSVFYTIAVGASELITKHAKINATAEPVGGSSANVRGLGAKKIEFAIANSFASFSGFNGSYSFKKSGKVPVRLVLQGQASNRWLMVRKGANIKTAQDLKGRTIIAKRRALPEIALVMSAFNKVHGLDAGSMKLVATTNTGQLVKAIRAGSVDAAVMPFSPRAAQVQKPMSDGVLDFFYVDKAKRDAMLKHLPPMFWANTLKKGLFQNQMQAANVVSLNTYVITRPGVSDDTVYKVTKAILDNTKEFATYHKAGRQYSLKRALQNVALPFHPGAVRYFKEKGVWTGAHEANQNKLMAQ